MTAGRARRAPGHAAGAVRRPAGRPRVAPSRSPPAPSGWSSWPAARRCMPADPPVRRLPCRARGPHRRRRAVRARRAVPVRAAVPSRPPSWHRRAGRVVAVAGLARGRVGAVADPVLRRSSRDRRPAVRAAASCSPPRWPACLVLGFAAIRRRDIAAHRAWMIRAYAIGLAAGTQAFTEGLGGGHLRHRCARAATWPRAPAGSSTSPSPNGSSGARDGAGAEPPRSGAAARPRHLAHPAQRSIAMTTTPRIEAGNGPRREATPTRSGSPASSTTTGPPGSADLSSPATATAPAPSPGRPRPGPAPRSARGRPGHRGPTLSAHLATAGRRHPARDRRSTRTAAHRAAHPARGTGRTPARRGGTGGSTRSTSGSPGPRRPRGTANASPTPCGSRPPSSSTAAATRGEVVADLMLRREDASAQAEVPSGPAAPRPSSGGCSTPRSPATATRPRPCVSCSATASRTSASTGWSRTASWATRLRGASWSGWACDVKATPSESPCTAGMLAGHRRLRNAGRGVADHPYPRSRRVAMTAT